MLLLSSRIRFRCRTSVAATAAVVLHKLTNRSTCMQVFQLSNDQFRDPFCSRASCDGLSDRFGSCVVCTRAPELKSRCKLPSSRTPRHLKQTVFEIDVTVLLDAWYSVPRRIDRGLTFTMQSAFSSTMQRQHVREGRRSNRVQTQALFGKKKQAESTKPKPKR